MRVARELIAIINTSNQWEIQSILQQINFASDDINIDDVLEFIESLHGHNDFTIIFEHIAHKYNFKSAQEELSFIKIIHDYAPQQVDAVFPGHFMQRMKLSYEAAILIAKELNNGYVIANYIISKANFLSAEQKLALIMAALDGNTFIILSNCASFKLNGDDLSSIYKEAKGFYGIVEAFRSCAWNDQQILAFVEELMLTVDPDDGYLDIKELFATKDDIESFVIKHSGWGHVLDSWVQLKLSEGGITNEEAKGLLRLRFNQSEHHVDDLILNYYGIVSEQDIRAIVQDIPLNVPIYLLSNINLVAWSDIYNRCKYAMQKNIGGVLDLCSYINHNGFNPDLKFIADLEPLLDPDELSLLSDNGREQLNTVYGIVNKKISAILELSEAENNSLSKIVKAICNDNFGQNKFMVNVIVAYWLVGLYVRLLAETAMDNLKHAFRQPAFIETIIEIAKLAAPSLRTNLVDHIINLVNNRECLDNFCQALKNTSKRHCIPALIMFGNTQASTSPELTNIIGNIKKAYTNTRKMVILINGLMSLFAANLSDQEKIAVLKKVLTYNVRVVDELPAEDMAEFNSAYISTNFGLLAISIDGKLLNIEDIRTNTTFASLSSLLQALSKNNKKWQDNLDNIKAALGVIGLFAIGINSELQALLMLQGLAAINNLSTLVESEEFKKQSWLTNYARTLQICFNISDEKLPLTILQLNKCRNPFSLIAYYGKLSSLKNAQPFLDMLSQFVQSISSEDAHEFYINRYDLQQQPQLKLALGNNPELLKFWRYGSTEGLDNFFARIKHNLSMTQETELDVLEFLKRRSLEHLTKTLFPIVHEYLAAESPAVKEGILINAENTFNNGIETHNNNILGLKKITQISIGLIKLFEDFSVISNEKTIQRLHAIRKLTEQHENCEQFYIDLSNAMDWLKNKQSGNKKDDHGNVEKYKDQIITDTDHFWDMFMMGTDVMGSCQDINGSASLNCCLIGGYVLSGHIRQIAIIDTKTEKILARSVLRLMWDEIYNLPVLFIEEPYPHLTNVLYKQAIIEFAKLRATELGCSLVSLLTNAAAASETYPNPLRVIAVKHAEYVDALGAQQRSPYEIDNASWLYNPALSLKSKPPCIFSQEPADNKFGLCQDEAAVALRGYALNFGS